MILHPRMGMVCRLPLRPRLRPTRIQRRRVKRQTRLQTCCRNNRTPFASPMARRPHRPRLSPAHTGRKQHFKVGLALKDTPLPVRRACPSRFTLRPHPSRWPAGLVPTARATPERSASPVLRTGPPDRGPNHRAQAVQIGTSGVPDGAPRHREIGDADARRLPWEVICSLRRRSRPGRRSTRGSRQRPPRPPCCGKGACGSCRSG
jgi:hypothetical protein